ETGARPGGSYPGGLARRLVERFPRAAPALRDSFQIFAQHFQLIDAFLGQCANHRAGEFGAADFTVSKALGQDAAAEQDADGLGSREHAIGGAHLRLAVFGCSAAQFLKNRDNQLRYFVWWRSYYLIIIP